MIGAVKALPPSQLEKLHRTIRSDYNSPPSRFRRIADRTDRRRYSDSASDADTRAASRRISGVAVPTMAK